MKKAHLTGFLVTLVLCGLAVAAYLQFSVAQNSTPTPTNTPINTPTPINTASATKTPYETPVPTNEITVPKPSIPEFTLKLIDSSYDVPTTYYIDTFGSGKNETRPGYHVEAKNITVAIKNQPFNINNPDQYSLFYNVRYRVDGGNWKEIYSPQDGYPTQSNSDNTTLSFSSSNETNGRFLDMSTSPPWSFAITAPSNSILEMQVEAMIGYVHRVFNPNSTNQLNMYPYVFTGETSDWSNTQTITINAGNPSFTASLSESASALNYGNKINFTVSVDGGVPLYTFAWYIDGQIAENSSSQYFSTDSQAVGSHHVYVQVIDADNNSATTLTVEFNVLPASSNSLSSSLSPSSSPTQQPTLKPDYVDNTWSNIVTIFFVAVFVSASIWVILKKHQRKKVKS